MMNSQKCNVRMHKSLIAKLDKICTNCKMFVVNHNHNHNHHFFQNQKKNLTCFMYAPSPFACFPWVHVNISWFWPFYGYDRCSGSIPFMYYSKFSIKFRFCAFFIPQGKLSFQKKVLPHSYCDYSYLIFKLVFMKAYILSVRNVFNQILQWFKKYLLTSVK